MIRIVAPARDEGQDPVLGAIRALRALRGDCPVWRALAIDDPAESSLLRAVSAGSGEAVTHCIREMESRIWS